MGTDGWWPYVTACGCEARGEGEGKEEEEEEEEEAEEVVVVVVGADNAALSLATEVVALALRCTALWNRAVFS